jgi:phospholipid/cholesterol/gamma-HCH transport system permease protein
MRPNRYDESERRDRRADTLGIDPIDFLVTPRMLALVLMIPALTMYSSLMGIIGGAIVGLAMIDASFVQYTQQTISAVTLGDHSQDC